MFKTNAMESQPKEIPAFYPADIRACAPDFHRRLSRIATIGAFATVVAFHLYSLMLTPPISVDEAWNANRAWSFLQTGRAFGTLDEGVFQNFQGYWTYFPWLGSVLHAVFIRVLGLSLFSLRIASVVFGAILLFALYVIGRRLAGRLTATMAVVAAGFSSSFFYSGHMARHDVIVAAMGFSAIALLLTDKSAAGRFSWLSIAAGLLCGLTLDIHPNGMIYWAAIIALYIYSYGRQTLIRLRFWSFMTGLGIGIVFFLAMHVLPYGGTYFALAKICSVGSRVPPLFSLAPRQLLDSLLYTAYQMNFLVTLFAIVGVVVLLRGGRGGDRQLLIIFGVIVLAFAAVVRNKARHYAIYIEPAACLIMARLLDVAWASVKSSSIWRRVIGIVTWEVAAASFALALVVAMPKYDVMHDYRMTVQRLRELMPDGGSVIGTQAYWFGLRDRRYYSWDQLVYYKRYVPGSTVADGFRQFQPEYLLLDAELELHFIRNENQIPKNMWFLHLPRQELDDLLARHAVLIGEVRSATYKTIHIYKLKWK